MEKPTNKELENRYTHHAPVQDQTERYQIIRSECLRLAKRIVKLTPASPEQDRALDALDIVMFNSNAAIARRE